MPKSVLVSPSVSASMFTKWIVFGSACFSILSARSDAQATDRPAEKALGASIVIYELSRSRSQTPKSAMGLNAMVGRSLTSFLKWRAGGSAWFSLPAGDAVSICEPLPGGGCASAPAVPDRLWIGELQALVGLIPGWIYGLVGVGGVVPQGGDGESFPTRGLARIGLEVGDGQRWGGIRIQVSRVEFSGPIRDLRWGQDVGLLLRF